MDCFVQPVHLKSWTTFEPISDKAWRETIKNASGQVISTVYEMNKEIETDTV